MSGVDPRGVIAGAVVAMQLNPDMPTVHCRNTTHGPLSRLSVDSAGALVLVCAECGSVAAVTEDQVRMALGAAVLPSAPDVAVFGSATPSVVGAVELRRAPLRIDTIAGSVRVVTVFALLTAVVVVLKAADFLSGWALFLLAVVVAGGLDLAGVHLARRRNRDRSEWLPGLDVHVADLDPGTWIETPLDLRAPDRFETHAPKRATRVLSVTGVAESPQSGHVEVALADGHVYTVRGDAPIRTLHVQPRPAVTR